jgi:hypothetical protein
VTILQTGSHISYVVIIYNKISRNADEKNDKEKDKTETVYGSEIWVKKNKHVCKIQAAEIKFLKSVVGCTKLYKNKNEDNWKELYVYSVNRLYTENDQYGQ